tara:strand:+ start:187 stop:660 length:474 start_codon:yes stop_codon:yes gene_type:complete
MIIIRSLLIIPIATMILLSSCAYEKMNSPDKKKFHITEINTDGERRAAFIIQKKINRFSNELSTNKIKIFINLAKLREIQEKNMQNKVTKYKVSLSAKIVITELLSTKEFKRSFSTSQIYDVTDRYTDTLNNEKNANNVLVNKVVDEILEQLRILYN